MTFKPDSTIYLCNVPIDSTYKNQIYFASKDLQSSYFSSKVVKSFTNYLTVRKTLPSGQLQSSVKVDCNIDTLQSLGCNYMYYQNNNHGNKIFYAFINNLIYVNEGTTEIVFECDVYQTWLFNVTIKPSYVIREHSKNDTIGGNLVPEKFTFQDYEFSTIPTTDFLSQWGYLVAATEEYGTDLIRGNLFSGIYQGLYFYYYKDYQALNTFLDSLEEEGGDCIVFIAVIPQFNLSNNNIIDGDNATENQGEVMGSNEPALQEIIIDMSAYSFTFGGYVPKNNKLYTNPYFNMIVSNHNGEEAIYNFEDFSARNNIKFKAYGDISANPSVTMFPCNYKGITNNYDSGISISGFPQCAFNSDTFKLWLAKNQYGVAMDTIGNIAQIATGLGIGLATGGVGLALGGSQAVTGVMGIGNTINNVYQASKEPNKAHSGSAKTNLLTAIGFNKFTFYCRRIKKEYAQTIDDFFTMFGYQTNRVKLPNVNARPYFNYVQTADINIVGGIPSDDMKRLKAMYNSGVTLWKHTATIGDYSVDNQAPNNASEE